MCNNTGEVSCNNCSNVVIEGITWNRCGDPQKQEFLRGGDFKHLLNHKQLFKHSKLCALSLHYVSGYFIIKSIFDFYLTQTMT